MKLKPKKTSILIVAKKSGRERNDNIRIATPPDEEYVKPKKLIKVLGWILNTKIKYIMSSMKTITA